MPIIYDSKGAMRESYCKYSQVELSIIQTIRVKETSIIHRGEFFLLLVISSTAIRMTWGNEVNLAYMAQHDGVLTVKQSIVVLTGEMSVYLLLSPIIKRDTAAKKIVARVFD
jgi:hypothetical protein